MKRYCARTFSILLLLAASWVGLHGQGAPSQWMQQGLEHQKNEKYATALDYFLRSLNAYEQQSDTASIRKALLQIGHLYDDWGVPQKAVEHYLHASKLGSLNDVGLERLGESYLQIQQPKKAIEVFEKQLLQRQQRNPKEALSSLHRISDIYQSQGQYGDALKYTLRALEKEKEAQDSLAAAASLNNAGFLHSAMGQQQQALPYLKESLSYYESIAASNAVRKDMALDAVAGIANNIGFYYLFEGQPQQALSYFQKGFEIYEGLGKKKEMAVALNNMSRSHFLMENYYPSKTYSEEAISIAQQVEAQEELAVAYKNLSALYERVKFNRKALQLYKEYARIKDQMLSQAQDRKQKGSQKAMEAEQVENEKKMALVDKEIIELNLKQEKLKAEQREKELALLEANSELQESKIRQQELAKGKAEQELQIAQQELSAQEREQQLLKLEKQQALREAKLREEALLKEEMKRERQILESQNAVLQKENQLKQSELQQEAQFRYFGTALLLLAAVIIVLIAIGYRKIQKSSRLMKEQKDEIEQQNMELEQQKEEINVQKERLADAVKNISIKNKNLTDSIRYAQTIQDAILPSGDALKGVLGQYFLYYLPKDIVSGDFYWCDQVKGHNIIVVSDCTGHGVPGAFMSMIGAAALNEIIVKGREFAPHKILSKLDVLIRESLKQEERLGNQDGMDIGLCVWKEEEGAEVVTVQYAGAKQRLIYKAENAPLSVVKGDRHSIGGRERNKKKEFTAKSVQLPLGTMVYMGTDGYVDQCDPNRRKFGSKRYRALLEECAHLPLPQQKERVGRALKEYQREEAQRDDITLLGFKI